LSTILHSGVDAGTIPSAQVAIGHLQVSPSDAVQQVILPVSLNNSEPTPLQIAGFQFELEILGPDEYVSFSAILPPQDLPYLFAPNSASPLASISPDGQRVIFGDFLDAGFGEVVTGKGLGTIQLLVHPEAAGQTYQVRVNSEPTASFLAVNTTGFVPFAAQDGSIAVVPELSAAALLLIAMVSLSVCHRSKQLSRQTL
jgi:hypothetical protein